jgi:hypothetical protein
MGVNVIINGIQSRNFSTFWTYVAGLSDKVHRFGLFLKDENRQWQVT